jgi:hypothetical protein
MIPKIRIPPTIRKIFLLPPLSGGDDSNAFSLISISFASPSLDNNVLFYLI